MTSSTTKTKTYTRTYTVKKPASKYARVQASVDDFNSKLKAKGYVRIGKGAYSTAFSKPEKKIVVKTFRKDNNKNYLKYLNWCIEQVGNPFVPKVFSITYFSTKNVTDDFVVVKMERLTATRSVINKETHNQNKIEQRITKVIDLFRWGTAARRMQVKEVQALHPKARRRFVEPTLAFIKELMVCGREDLHNGNMMLRGSQIVITDPVAG